MTTIEIPVGVLRAARMSADDVRRELAILLFQQGKLSFGTARDLANLDAWTFQQLLGSRGIPPHYDIDDYREDLSTIDALDAE